MEYRVLINNKRKHKKYYVAIASHIHWLFKTMVYYKYRIHAPFADNVLYFKTRGEAKQSIENYITVNKL